MVTNNLLDFTSECYGVDKSTFHFISDSTNQIYSFKKEGRDYILRFSNRPAEKINEVKAEMFAMGC